MHTYNQQYKRVYTGILLACLLVGIVFMTLFSCEAFVTTEKNGVVSVSIDSEDFSLGAGKTLTLTATVEVLGTTAKTVTWASDKPEIAKVDADGLVTGMTEGEATITATSADPDETATVTVDVTTDSAVSETTLNLDNANIDVIGNTTTAIISATVKAINGGAETVHFVETDKEGNPIGLPKQVVTFVPHATEANTIVLTAKAPGETWIVATSTLDNTKKSAPTKITVNGVVSVGIVEGNLNNLGVDGKKTLTANVLTFGTTTKEVTWQSLDETIATVVPGTKPGTGKVTGVNLGTTTITATSKADDTKKATIEVTVVADGVSVSIVEENFNLAVGTNLVLTPKVEVFGNVTNKSVTWLSDNKEVATVILGVAGTGKVTGVNLGTTTITAISEADNTQRASVEVTVTVPLSYAEVTRGADVTKNPVVAGVTITEYTLEVIGTKSRSVKLPTIHPNTGAITVKPNTTAGTYRITATTDAGGNVEAMFYVTTSPTTLPNLETAVRTGVGKFGLTANLNYIKTDAITSMKGLFDSDKKNGVYKYGAKSGIMYFNGDISLWNVSNVEDMTSIFENAGAFNGDISKWNVSNVTNMEEMFFGASVFNGDISKWKVNNVKNMQGMFKIARTFSGDLSKWNVASVTNMSAMFFYARAFKSNLSEWKVDNVHNMSHMFTGVKAFESDLSKWNVSKVTNMSFMFKGAIKFKSDLSEWKVDNVKYMQSVFHNATKFDSDLSKWNVAKVENMKDMFKDATKFKANNIEAWGDKLNATANKNQGVTITDMFTDSGLEKDNNLPTWYPYVRSVALNLVPPTLSSIDKGNTTTMKATVEAFGTADTTVTFIETNATGGIIADIDKNKIVKFAAHATEANTIVLTGEESGEAWIVAISTFDDTKKSAPTKITVNGVSVSIVEGNLNNLGVDDKKTLTAKVEVFGNVTDKSVTWLSDNKEVATVILGVAGTGKVTGVNLGTTTITAISEADNTQRASVEVTVTVPLSYAEVTRGADVTKNPVVAGVTITEYTLEVIGTKSRNVKLPTIHPNTGAITVKPNTTAGTYRITATTDAGGNVEAMFYVTTSPTTLSNLETVVQAGVNNFGLTADLNYIKTDAITNMTGLFDSLKKNGVYNYGAKSRINYFNGDISKWNVSNVTNMKEMFFGASVFNGDISKWKVNNVKNMQGMFKVARSFNGDLSKWNVAKVTNMSAMFFYAEAFTSNLSGWKVDNVNNMSHMFTGVKAFESDLSKWNVSKVTNMSFMFKGTIKFKSDLSGWKVDNVKHMQSVFHNVTQFDSDLSKWNIAKVENMKEMFRDATKFKANNLETWGDKLNATANKNQGVTITDMFTGSGLEKDKKLTTPTWYKP